MKSSRVLSCLHTLININIHESRCRLRSLSQLKPCRFQNFHAELASDFAGESIRCFCVNIPQTCNFYLQKVSHCTTEPSIVCLQVY